MTSSSRPGIAAQQHKPAEVSVRVCVCVRACKSSEEKPWRRSAGAGAQRVLQPATNVRCEAAVREREEGRRREPWTTRGCFLAPLLRGKKNERRRYAWRSWRRCLGSRRSETVHCAFFVWFEGREMRGSWWRERSGKHLLISV